MRKALACNEQIRLLGPHCFETHARMESALCEHCLCCLAANEHVDLGEDFLKKLHHTSSFIHVHPGSAKPLEVSAI
jgi:hypothetical protein